MIPARQYRVNTVKLRYCQTLDSRHEQGIAV
jgi:hypothetical protein